MDCCNNRSPSPADDSIDDSAILKSLITNALTEYKNNRFGLFSFHGRTGLKRIEKIQAYLDYLSSTVEDTSAEKAYLIIIWVVIHCSGETIADCFCQQVATYSRQNIYFKNIDNIKDKYLAQSRTQRNYLLVEDVILDKLSKMMLLAIKKIKTNEKIQSLITYLDDEKATLEPQNISVYIQNKIIGNCVGVVEVS